MSQHSAKIQYVSSLILFGTIGLLQTGLAYVFYFGPMSVLPVRTVAILGYIEPVVSVLCSAFVLREPLSISGWLGAVLIIGAAIVSERP